MAGPPGVTVETPLSAVIGLGAVTLGATVGCSEKRRVTPAARNVPRMVSR
jgi:hypothetical protein